jgi:ABC-2 type transport system ATP-binding protein
MGEAGTTFILTTHDLEDVKLLADHIIIINKGVKVFDDTLQKLQMSLGEKKIVGLTLDNPLEADFSAPVKIIEKKSPLELTLEVDISEIPIDKFIGSLSQQASFSDISVRELPMEEIISRIYEE